ncbi:hypothetical protein CAEBREN_25148 [Caenorhabditis brenneri]|uniref:Sdz-33 F-box domain-containing protein n=1 Tax=Caenorhabditis brenneri TaxID=135651 RepID=G0NHV5_CAEBE|nr:hypothetical protein CAEBREN_25148 [Caenorhabditis brenneri]
MQQFKLWKLPALARDKVIRQMVLAEVIYLSLVSKSFKRFLMAYKLHATLFLWSLRAGTRNFMNVLIEFNDDRHDDVEFIFGQYCEYNPKNTKPIKESGFSFNRRGNTSFVMNFDGSPARLLGMMEMSKFLLDILFVEKYAVERNTVLFNFVDFEHFILRTTQKFHSFRFSTRATYLTMDQLKYLLETIQTENLHLSIEIRNPHCGDPAEIPLRVSDSLVLYNCNWFSTDNLLESKAKKIDVRFVTSVLPDDVTRIMKSWMEGTKLKEMTNMCLHPVSRKVMEQLDMLNGVSRYNHPEASDKHRQMKRVKDGKIAVFDITLLRELRITVS